MSNEPVFLIGFWCVLIYSFANGILALASPERWLNARWAAKLGFRQRDLQSPRGRLRIRIYGLIFMAAAPSFMAVVVSPAYRVLRGKFIRFIETFIFIGYFCLGW